MKKAAIVGWACWGLLAAGCGGSDNLYGPQRSSAAGAGGRAGADNTSTGGGGISTGGGGILTGGGGISTGTGGVGGSILPPGGSGGLAGAGSGPTKAGVYSEPVVEAEDPPPPLSGGTLAIIGQGHRAAVSDPDGDQVFVVDLDAMTIVSTIALSRGDEPGRVVEDNGGRLHVALRGGRAVAVLDAEEGAVLGRLPVCVHPRGLAFDATTGAVHVACAGGELVSYTADAGIPLRKLRLERDLRDVVVDGNRLLVSRFRAAEILVVESNGTVSGKLRPPVSGTQTTPTPPPGIPPPPPPPGIPPLPARIAAVAWRTIASPDGGALMVYQLLRTSSVPTTPGGYGGSCSPIISTAVSVLRVDGSGSTVENVSAVLPLDVATNATREAAVVSAAWTPGTNNPFLGWHTTLFPPTPTLEHPRMILPCKGPPPPPVGPLASDLVAPATPPGRVIAIGYGPNQQIVVQSREPAALVMGARTLLLPGRTRKHTGHELFHLGTLGGLACASCHPEGHEDGQVWTFAGLGPRRTQSISGGISGTEPFHWSGDMSTFSTLAHDVFNSRMTGPSLSSDHVESLFRWIDQIPRMEAPPAENPDAAERGRVLFNDDKIACATCHGGEKFTNNATRDVNTGAAFQVPSLLGLAWRAPYMHHGCAATLANRFDACGGGDFHGHTSELTAQERADLVAYLDTL